MKKINAVKIFILLFIPYCLFVGVKIASEYKQIHHIETKINYEGSKVLKNFLRSFRDVYLTRFIDLHIEFTPETVQLLPAVTITDISKKFSALTQGQAQISTVSDRPRNPLNALDQVQQQAFDFFKTNPEQQELFRDIEIDSEKFTFYASPIHIKEGCLECHGPKALTLPFIRDSYDTAFDYQLGDLRGIISIKISRNRLHADLFNDFFVKTTTTTLLSGFVSFIVIYLLLRTIKRRDDEHISELTGEVAKKTHSLQSSLNTLEGYKIALDESSIVSKADPTGKITYINQTLCDVTGYSENELLGKPHSILRDPQVSKRVFEDLWQTIQNKHVWHGLFSNRRKDGSIFWATATIAPILNNRGEITEYIGVRQDVTELVSNREKLQQLLTSDALTGLPNRYTLLRDLEPLDKASIILLDIHNFGSINDCYGVDVGDQIIGQLSRRIKKSADVHGLLLYRLLGDQFALFCPEPLDADDLVSISRMVVHDAVQTPLQIDANTIFINLICGLCFHSRDPLIAADIALKKAKTSALDFVILDGEDDSRNELKNNQHWIARLQRALQYDRIRPFYQPIVDSQTKQIVKYECLVRLIEEDGQIISPFTFLDIAKKARLYPQVTQAVVNHAFATFAELPYEFSINLSSEDITNPMFIDFFIDKLSQCSFSQRLIVEILETEGFEQYEQVAEFIHRVKEFGVQIAIDDFGTGHSNYERLMKLDVDYLKIDGSIIRQITSDDVAATIAETITMIAAKIGVKTVAEFVFDEDTAQKASAIGCDYLQGFHYAEPLQTIEHTQNITQ